MTKNKTNEVRESLERLVGNARGASLITLEKHDGKRWKLYINGDHEQHDEISNQVIVELKAISEGKRGYQKSKKGYLLHTERNGSYHIDIDVEKKRDRIILRAEYSHNFEQGQYEETA